MEFTCNLHVIYMLHFVTKHLHVIYMSFTCYLQRLFTSVSYYYKIRFVIYTYNMWSKIFLKIRQCVSKTRPWRV